MIKKVFRIPFTKGLLESQESSTVPPDFLTDCENWVPEISGGLRVRGKWFKGTTTGGPGTAMSKGIGVFSRATDPAVVQMTAASVATSTPASPAPTWAAPTHTGNLLLLVCATGYVAASVTAITNTPGGSWVSAGSVTDIAGTAGGKTELFYIANAASQTGAQTFTNGVTVTGVNVAARSTWWLMEISGIATASSVDVTASNTSAASTTLTVTSAATTQASEFVIMVNSAAKVTTSFTVSTASTDWTERSESAGTFFGGGNTVAHSGAVYTRSAQRTTGTQSITVTSTATADHMGLLVTFKGWNTDAVPQGSVGTFITANDNGTSFDIKAIIREQMGTGTYLSVESTGLVSGGLPIQFTAALGRVYYTHTSFAGIRGWDGTGVATATGSPAGARAITTHLNRLWAGGTEAAGYQLYGSVVGNADDWSSATSTTISVGTDDGEPIECLAAFVSGLVIVKQNSVWFLDGDSTSNFTLLQLNGGGGAPGRTIIPTPYGVFIIGRHSVYSWLGAADTTRGATSSTVSIISGHIERTYGMTGNYMWGDYADGLLYVCDEGSGVVWVYDIVQQTWRTETIDETPATIFTYGNQQVYGPKSSTVAALLNYRTFPNPTRGKDFDSMSQTFVAQTGDFALAGARQPLTPRQLYIQLRQHGGDAQQTGLTVTPVFDGIDGEPLVIDPEDDPAVRRIPVSGFPQKAGVNTVGLKFEQTLLTGEASCFDIEDVYMDALIEGSRPGSSD